MLRFTPLVLSLALVACGGGGGGSDGPGNTGSSAIVTNSDELLKIVGNDQAQTLEKPKPAELIITGNDNIVIVKSNLSLLKITGNSNSIDLASGVTVSECKVIGNKNSLKKISSLPIQCDVSGTDNTGFN